MPCSVKSDESGAEDSLEWKVWSKSPEAVLSNGYENGKTALMFAAQYGGRNGEAMIRLLIDAGSEPKRRRPRQGRRQDHERVDRTDVCRKAWGRARQGDDQFARGKRSANIDDSIVKAKNAKSRQCRQVTRRNRNTFFSSFFGHRRIDKQIDYRESVFFNVVT